MSDGTMSLNELLQNAMLAEKQGVPVSWKDMCMTVYNAATNHIAALEKEIDQLSTRPETVEEHDTE